MKERAGFAAVLTLLVATGWAANHFAAVIPALREREVSQPVLDAVFGVYALGLLPGLFGGGAWSDRIGRARVAVPGAAIALAGSLVLAEWQQPAGLLAGRLVVGLGAGLAIGTGTAWAADLRGAAGAAAAGVALTAGFALGPVVSGALAEYLGAPTVTPFLVSAGFSALAIAAALTWAGGAAPARPASAPVLDGRSARTALARSLPLAPWVFACVTLAFVVLPTRLTVSGPGITGIAAGLALGTGIAVQTVARRGEWGPWIGIAGPLLAALGFALAALAGDAIGVSLFVLCCVLLGAAYGLCLRQGLLDLERWSPARIRGTLTGIFYVGAYLGFGLPSLLTAVRPGIGTRAPELVIAALAVLAAVLRAATARGSAPALSDPPATVAGNRQREAP